MADLAGIGSIISGIGSLGTGIAGTVLNNDISRRNLQFQKDVLNYQKQLQREIFQREDSAIQRRASDILAAGGNPALAYSGSGAGTGESVGVSAPQESATDYNLINSSLGMMQQGLAQFKQNQLTDASIKNLNASASKTNAETITEFLRQLQTRLQIARNPLEVKYLQNQIAEQEHNLQKSIDWSLRTTDPSSSVFNSGKSIISEISNRIPDVFDENTDWKSLLIDVGLLALPGFGALKVGSLGSKAIKSALTFFKGLKKNKMNLQDFYGTFYRLTGRAPSKSEVELFKQGVTQSVSKPKEFHNYYYDKYNSYKNKK